ncbi:hypothetical protein [Micromonospora chersina]|uniref:hypothetical protein n=1 Tax=Micromonospora chersina TaxID=47854 RepID=UPI0033F4254E
MTGELVGANVMRPRIPLVYLDLNTTIYIARARSGDTKVPRSYGDLYTAALRATFEQRAMFPLSGEHLWEIALRQCHGDDNEIVSHVVETGEIRSRGFKPTSVIAEKRFRLTVPSGGPPNASPRAGDA